MLLALLLLGCRQDAPLPFLGDCAQYPEGIYEFGQIGVGTCLAGPTDLVFTDDEEGRPQLLVSNANPYRTFTGGSLLSIPWDAVNEGAERNVISELGPGALALPHFVGGLAVRDDLALLASRHSEGSAVRQHFDDVWLVDLSNPASPTLASRGPGGATRLEVQSDPNDVVVDPVSGYAFVSNRTTHSISVIDAGGDEVRVVRPWPAHTLTGSRFDDRDGSGSRAEFAALVVNDPTLLTDERWSLDWVDGTWRVWTPGPEGLTRANSVGDGTWVDSAIGVELKLEDSGLSELLDPAWDGVNRLYFTDAGVLRVATTSGNAVGLWRFNALALLAGTPGAWDEGGVSAPGVLRTEDGVWIFYASESDGVTGIGAAFSAEGLAFDRAEAPLWQAGGGLGGGERVGHPSALVDPETGEHLVYYSHFDGEAWTLARATSDDLITWTLDEAPVLAPADADVASPEVSAQGSDWRMLYLRRGDDGRWAVHEARSDDGRTWDERGEVRPLDDSLALSDAPPSGVAFSAAPELRFRVGGEGVGPLRDPVIPGLPFSAVGYGWTALPVAGYTLGPGDAGPVSDGGVQIDSVLPELGLAYLTLQSAAGVERVGLARLGADGLPVAEPGAVLEGADGFDRDGASTPVVWEDPSGGYRMLYAGHRGARTRIGLATSPDGEVWTRVGQALGTGGDWDRASVEPGSVELLDDGRLRLWYSGFDGEVWRIGAALSEDGGQTFTREAGSSRGYTVPPGRPGDWDDSGVRQPWVLPGENSAGERGLHLWYAGFDGDVWRIGYGFIRGRDGALERWEDPRTGELEPILDALDTPFAPSGVRRPVLYLADDGGYEGFFTGFTDTQARVGRLAGLQPARLHRGYTLPTPGDALAFETGRGDPDANAIPLDVAVQGTPLSYEGLTSLTVDAERGFLYAASKLRPYLYVIDIRDDSTADFADLNYLDVEAVLPVANAGGGFGFRAVVPVAGADRLYGLHHNPESVWVVDIADLVDDEFPDFLYDTAQGWLPTARGARRDEGEATLSDVGPSALVAHPDGRHLFVANFNANSVSVYDLSLGPWGQLIREIDNVGENPAVMVLSPDARRLVVGNYAGEVAESGLAQSTLAVLDVDPASPTFLEVLTWVVNQ